MADINKKVEIDDSNSIVAQDNEDEGSDDNTTTASSSAAANAKKKKKKHRKRAAIVDEQGKTPESQEKLEEIRRRIAELAIEEERARKPSEVVNLVDDARMPKWAKPSDTDIARIENTQHKFWDNEPVPKLGELGANKNESMRHGVVADVPTTGYPLPPQLEWCTCDIGNADEMDEIYNLLKLHYVEDDDCLFRFLYGIDFLKWALTPPGWHPEWHVGIRALPKDGQKGKLLAFITGIPTAIRVYDKVISVAEINFLCVHKKLRSKRLAPLLIKEVTRRVHLKDVWHAVYTAGSVLPRPVASCTYYHRSINPRKLVDIKFSFLPNGMTMDRLIKRMYLPENTKSKTRPMTKLDVPAVHRLLTTALSNRKLAINWTQDEVGHWLIPRAGVVSTFVIEVCLNHSIW